MRGLVGSSGVGGGAAAFAQSRPARSQSAAKASLTGCVDERDGQYVLTNDTNLQPTARLKPAAGSPEDNFARHMGHKVNVRGMLSKEDPLPIMTVESSGGRFGDLHSFWGDSKTVTPIQKHLEESLWQLARE